MMDVVPCTRGQIDGVLSAVVQYTTMGTPGESGLFTSTTTGSCHVKDHAIHMA